ncbi:hypothetical protein EUTSA_v10000691mg [Eutrema salsugineum]|uniref:Protein arginine N-methyltransferase n=1 Tax=Eutrema salsugineum TaxID=72664 RepID=V4M2F1_EUTSA|nr:hypothetical protein EUTSA_v10000691mg [Eutrema salsugineum]
MPLGEREGWETSESRLCGVETEFSADVTPLFSSTSTMADSILSSLLWPGDSHVLPFIRSDLRVSASLTRVIGKFWSWIDLDSEYKYHRMDSETILKQGIAHAKDQNLRVWLRIPLRKSHGTPKAYNSEYSKDSWELWNAFRRLCDYDSNLCVALDVGIIPQSEFPCQISLERWLGEPVKAAFISTKCFVSNAHGQDCLVESYEELMTRLFHHSVQVIISEGPPPDDLVLVGADGQLLSSVTVSRIVLVNYCYSFGLSGTQTHPYKPYLDYISNLFNSMEPLSEQERMKLGYRDLMSTLLQPLKDNLDAEAYEMLEQDSYKYIQYNRAIARALKDSVPNEKASELTTVLMVVGAGRGPLVKASLEAAEKTGRKVKVYALEKNPNAVVTLHDLVKAKGWEGTVIVISCDVRYWTAPERADILVSNFRFWSLVSRFVTCWVFFGDNELSLECLDGAQRFLKPNGISIPCSYTSFIQPITTSKLYCEVKSHNNHSHFETAYSVKLHSVFTFTHPDFSEKHNEGYKKLRFDLPRDMGSALVHGTIFFLVSSLEYLEILLVKPVVVHSKAPIEAHFWRFNDSTKARFHVRSAYLIHRRFVIWIRELYYFWRCGGIMLHRLIKLREL